jgi:hypothetical protein
MTQQDRDRRSLKKAKKGLITQGQAAERIDGSERYLERHWPADACRCLPIEL